MSKHWMRFAWISLATALLAATAWLYLAGHKIDKQRVYRIGYGSDAPFHFRGADGKPTGLAVEMVQAAARRRGIRLEWIPITGSAIDPVRNGDLDFWVLLTIRPERRKLVYLTDPFLVTETCFLVKAEWPVRESGPTPDGPRELPGFRHPSDGSQQLAARHEAGRRTVQQGSGRSGE